MRIGRLRLDFLFGFRTSFLPAVSLQVFCRFAFTHARQQALLVSYDSLTGLLAFQAVLIMFYSCVIIALSGLRN